ncbi:MAG TPA: hypothetical protein VIX14_13710 [Terriglobales bacterium]
MNGRVRLFLVFVFAACCLPTLAQTQKALTNADILTMTKEGFAPSLIIKAIRSSSTDFDVSAHTLVELKNAGVDSSVMEAMLSAQADKPSAATEAARGAAAVAGGAAVDLSKPNCTANGCLLRDSSEVLLKFVAAVNSKTAHEGDPVEFVLDQDLKLDDSLVIAKGAHAVATVSVAKKAGMMGKPGELSIQIQYLIAGSNHIRLRGSKGREGEGKTGATVALTVLFGPIGLIKHGKDVEIAAGTPLAAYVDQDIWLPEIK